MVCELYLSEAITKMKFPSLDLAFVDNSAESTIIMVDAKW